jgi:two-component sensor histidine kinase
MARDEVERHLPANLAALGLEVGLLTTELVTNAVIHAHSVVDLDVYVYDDGLRVAVSDFGPGVPAIRTPSESGGGYGLHIVDEIATCWGHEPLIPSGKRVWFELRAPHDDPPDKVVAGVAAAAG